VIPVPTVKVWMREENVCHNADFIHALIIRAFFRSFIFAVSGMVSEFSCDTARKTLRAYDRKRRISFYETIIKRRE